MTHLTTAKISITLSGFPVSIMPLACLTAGKPVSEISHFTIERAVVNGKTVVLSPSQHNTRILCGDVPETPYELVVDIERGHVYCEASVDLKLEVVLHPFHWESETPVLLRDVNVNIGELWVHHSGGHYKIINFSNKEPKPGWETNVVYAKTQEPDNWFTRPLREFIAKFHRLDG